ncbi:polyhydroxyalkanoate synthase [Roseibium hamelinense]|uniref:Polyhydroxyalkanoate synthase n=1 Tax=Roseibium hamelinense TaxID=150831 RepID=A0A562SIM8_9HYPH|nr:alpha/beta fold hydrolase [Roseibium hamelinense]MTI43874.1 alpha/beta fold hydrolase [Roseibium hamelinense]TWI80834.1 polyhydroxyalkanoate synthase [Roseibium hamelinense]
MTDKRLGSATELARAATRFYTAALRDPKSFLSHSHDIWSATIKGALGQAELSIPKGDKRFNDPVWTTNPAYRAMASSYLAFTQGIDAWVDSLQLDDRNKLRAKLLTSVVADTISPTNTVLGNPTAAKTTFDHGGKNLVAGLKNFIGDMAGNGGLPAMVDKSKFTVGKNLALSPGQVVYREDHLELIQYTPQTEKVYSKPIFIVPPQINKYYVWDLAPGRSIVEYLAKQGHQVFVVVWRNPDPSQSDWDFNSYVAALDRASEVACEVSGSQSLQVVGACSGGITAAMLLSLWGAKKIKRAASFSLFVAILEVDGAKNTTMGLFANFETLELARLFSRSKGVLAGKDLERAFAWLRPNDLIWAYWVNNYLLGNEPPAYDILYWNADTTNLPASLHNDMLQLLNQGGLDGGDGWIMDGHKISLQNITCDAFVVGGETDHITPWDGCYASVHAFGGKSEFVLSQAGHIQSLINPPGNPRARFKTNQADHGTPEEFSETASTHSGSWWPHWNHWLVARGGKQVKAKQELGSAKHPPLVDAPGLYVQ